MTRTPTTQRSKLVTEWRGSAACDGYPHDLFFPIGDASQRMIKRAKAICSICQVAASCLEYALETNQRNGIWAGTTEDERRSLRRKWLAARRRAG